MNEEEFESMVEAFSWDDENPTIDFDEKEKPITEKEEVEKEDKEEEEEKPITLDFENFSEVEEEEGEEGTTVKNTEGEEEVAQVGIESVFTHLRDNGFISLSEEEEEEYEDLSEEEKAELLEDKYEAAIEERFIERVSGLPDSIKGLVKFAADGGDVDTYLQQMYKPRAEGISKKMDMEDEANQIKMMKYQMLQQDYDEEYIESHIESLKDTGKLESMSKKLHEKWVKDDNKNLQIKEEEQRKLVEQRKREAREYKAEVTKILQDNETIGSLKFSKEDSKTLPSYISDTYKTEDGRFITPFQRDIVNAMKDKEKMFVLAKLVRNNFDFKDIQKEAITKKTRELKKDIARQKTGKNIKSIGKETSVKRLSDYFTD